MNTLKIFNKDGSLYWQEHFNNTEDLEKWLEEEKTRPYWNNDFTVTKEEIFISPPELTEEEKNVEEKKISARKKLLSLGLNEEEINALLGF